MKSKLFSVARYSFLPLALAAVTACSDDNTTAPPPGSSVVTETDRDRLEATLTDTAVLRAMFGMDNEDPSLQLVLELVFANMKNMGTLNISSPAPETNKMTGVSVNRLASGTPSVRPLNGTPQGSYVAFGGQVVLTISEEDLTQKHVWTGIVAVNDLENPTDIIIAGIAQEDVSSAPSSIPNTSFDVEFDDTEAAASYIHRSGGTSTLYQAVSGQMNISSADFAGSSKPCSVTGYSILEIEEFSEIVLSNCKTTNGAIKGSFNFTAEQVGGDGTVVVPVTTFNLASNRTFLSVAIPAPHKP